MTIIDISRRIDNKMAVWPGTDSFELISALSLANGDIVNMSTFNTAAHIGTHVDAPFHFAPDSATMEQSDIQIYWGKAQVVTVTDKGGPLYPADLNDYDLSLAKRLLVKTPASMVDPTEFPHGYIYPSPELADLLGEIGIILYGTDAPSMDHVESSKLPGHHAMYRNGIAILEWLDLSGVDDGVYELVALPLKIVGGDGSPVRAALRTVT